MTDLSRAAALLAVLGTAVVYGTDVFCALVQRAALAHVDDRALVTVMGSIHRYGDRRMPVPGVIGLISAALSAGFAAIAGQWAITGVTGSALALLLAWLVLYTRVSAPVNKRFTAHAQAGQTPPDARDLQHKWDSVITARAALQGLAVTALCIGLVI